MRRTALVLLVGCATTTPRPGVLQPLGDTVALTEVTADGDRLPIAGDGLAEVDINSRIEVHVDKARVEALFATEQPGDTPEVARVKTRLKALTQLTDRQHQALTQLISLEAALVKEGNPTRPSRALETAIVQFNNTVLPLNDEIQRYAVEVGQQPGAYFAKPGAEGVFQALDEERQKVLAEADALANSSGLRWRMQAVFAKGKPIHLDNYDSYADGPFAVVDKLEPQTTAKEISTQFEEAKQLSKDLKNLAGLKDILIRAALSTLQDLLRSLQQAVHDDLAALEPVVKEIPDNALAIKEVGAVKKQIDDVISILEALHDRCGPVLGAIKQGTLHDIDLGQGDVCVRAVMQYAPGLLAGAKSAGDAVAALIAFTRKSPGKLGALLQPIQALIPKLAIVTQLQQWGAATQTGWSRIKTLLELNTGGAATAQWNDAQQTDHVLAGITDTTIDLRRTDRKEDDLLHFRPAIMKKDGSAAVLGATHDMRVVRMGAYLDVSAGVGFVDKKDNAWGPFAAAPEILAAVHYRARPSTSGARFFNAVRPGLGVHFLYPDLGTKQVSATGEVTGDDPSFELGVGGTLTVFGDLIQVGVGYDLQVNVSYWYVGFGLSTLTKLGVRFSPGG